MATASEKLALAKKHLAKARTAWDPPDWADLSFFGFYCLEAAVEAAAIHHSVRVRKTHPSRVEAAVQLHEQHGLPAVSDLLRDLNEIRKKEAYGDVLAPSLNAEDVVAALERYVEVVNESLS